ncbi:hypothetical protein P8850_06535 [Bacillus inaquosorum]|nr:hypothetical protein [Bacillus inaquosorum]MCY8723304.1 hypothetical protein [Bacillus inaquosorum]MEC0637462.1 hypothetical protein [Bacillus inaquosorum]
MITCKGMVPSITTYTLKDGTKRKHVITSVAIFIIKDLLLVKLIPLKHTKQRMLLSKRLNNLVLNKKKLSKTLINISFSSAQSRSQLNKELEKLQEKYMEAFEKNILPIDILQERLQKVSNEKRELEQAKNEIIIQLGSFDSKLIEPKLIE